MDGCQYSPTDYTVRVPGQPRPTARRCPSKTFSISGRHLLYQKETSPNPAVQVKGQGRFPGTCWLMAGGCTLVHRGSKHYQRYMRHLLKKKPTLNGPIFYYENSEWVRNPWVNFKLVMLSLNTFNSIILKVKEKKNVDLSQLTSLSPNMPAPISAVRL